MDKPLRIVFMGTPAFAVPSLERLLDKNYNIVAVVTAIDKPAGRGLKLQASEIKLLALSKNLTILQPINLNDDTFLQELKSLMPDLMIVVAFRKLPEKIWRVPRLGTFNLHASLLPQYRGASPINWAIINGETKTGLSTFFINDKIDTGKIIYQKEIEILPNETAGELHDKLLIHGADLVIKTVKSIENNAFPCIEQTAQINEKNKLAPKINKADCRINWNNTVDNVDNFIRGLSPYPAAYTELISADGKKYLIKIYKSSKSYKDTALQTGNIFTDSKTFVSIAVADGFIKIEEIQLAGKKKMQIDEFLMGFPINDMCKVSSFV